MPEVQTTNKPTIIAVDMEEQMVEYAKSIALEALSNSQNSSKWYCFDKKL